MPSAREKSLTFHRLGGGTATWRGSGGGVTSLPWVRGRGDGGGGRTVGGEFLHEFASLGEATAAIRSAISSEHLPNREGQGKFPCSGNSDQLPVM